MILAFDPTNATFPPWSGKVTLDGSPYLLSAYWNTYAQRWYVQLTTHQGDVIQTTPLIGSPNDFDIPLFPGLFSTTVIYRESPQQFEIGETSVSTTSAQAWSDVIRASYTQSNGKTGSAQHTAIPGSAIPGYAIPGTT